MMIRRSFYIHGFIFWSLLVDSKVRGKFQVGLPVELQSWFKNRLSQLRTIIVSAMESPGVLRPNQVVCSSCSHSLSNNGDQSLPWAPMMRRAENFM